MSIKSRLINNLKFSGLTLILIVALVPLFQAFEAHIVNVTAEVVLIDAPLITTGDQEPNTAFIIEQDDDATDVFYTILAGVEPESLTDPVCGDTLGGPIAGVYSVDVSNDTVIKAMACDAAGHHSILTVRVFVHEEEPVQELQLNEESTENENTTEENITEEPSDDEITPPTPPEEPTPTEAETTTEEPTE